MDLYALKYRLSQREAELETQSAELDVKVADDLARLSAIKRKIAVHEKFMKLAGVRRQFRTQLKIAYEKMNYGRTRFMSLDVERTPEGHFQEVGITLFRGREIESFNYRIKGVQRGPVFLFGNTIEAEFDVVKNLILLHAETADVYVGHSFNNDLKHLEAESIFLPRKFYYDTAVWSKAIYGFAHSLVSLTREYHTAGQMFHCGGNDARYTAEVLIKMIYTHYEEYYPRPVAS